MSSFSLSTIGPGHLIGLLAVKATALTLAVSLTEQQGRALLPMIGGVYAVLLPFVLWLLRP
ncbi:MAG: hypothetical protein AAGE80_17320 [Pseudomonadota bacterium]